MAGNIRELDSQLGVLVKQAEFFRDRTGYKITEFLKVEDFNQERLRFTKYLYRTEGEGLWAVFFPRVDAGKFPQSNNHINTGIEKIIGKIEKQQRVKTVFSPQERQHAKGIDFFISNWPDLVKVIYPQRANRHMQEIDTRVFEEVDFGELGAADLVGIAPNGVFLIMEFFKNGNGKRKQLENYVRGLNQLVYPPGSKVIAYKVRYSFGSPVNSLHVEPII